MGVLSRWKRSGWRWRIVFLLSATFPLTVLVLNLRLYRLIVSETVPSPVVLDPGTLHPKFKAVLDDLIQKLTSKPVTNLTLTWATARKWTEEENTFSLANPIGDVLTALRTARIVSADNSRKGTQFKLSLTLEGDQKVFFKPRWYNRDEIIRGPVYSGKDRHNAEVVAFYLAAILDIRWTPVAVMRRVNIETDIWNKASSELKDTMFRTDSGSLCMYGKCFYCRRNESVCSDKKNEIEGTMLLVVNQKFLKYRSPWQRTYDNRKQADWEVNPHYCTKVKKNLSTTRILDLIDASVLDYLLQNGDRHHYETMNDRVVLLDNGKGLGNPNKDFNDILAPLYQCCMLRESTWKRLKLLSEGYLSTTLSRLLSQEVGHPIVTDEHLQAMDRRVRTVYATVDTCLSKHGRSIFMKPRRL